MASQERFELPTDGLEGRCSILLSYWDNIFYVNLIRMLGTIFIILASKLNVNTQI